MEVEGPKGLKGPKGIHGSRRENQKDKVIENEVLLRHLLTHFKRALLRRKEICMYTIDAFCSSL